ncbi:olfactory receptor 6C1-like [Bufo gargarizans]|uniref:olfactory receptor 6C1-like n=1 Tax=Bufo gargarizans TaxID=30331 RepID=UPI001CF551CE|nr:olfactory receptor 6C1-like [Bufo gargarizans]
MDGRNVSTITYLIITGISGQPLLQLFFFLLVLLIYLIILAGNTIIFLLVCLDDHLHTPMYFFLANLSILDISCSTITLHKILTSFISGDNTVSVVECLVQIFTFVSLTCDELLVLAAMSYDRYVAICNPLHYHRVMNSKLCVSLASLCWVCGFLEGTPGFIMLVKVTCYESNEVDHFFCDIVPLLKLSCNDTSLLQLYILTLAVIVCGFTPFALTFISYIFIIATILSIRSSSGRRKAFYTCSSHLTVVICLYSSIAFQYMRPISSINLGSSKYFSLFNVAAVPMLNPLIYSLKNKDVKAAIRRRMNLAVVSINNQGHSGNIKTIKTIT